MSKVKWIVAIFIIWRLLIFFPLFFAPSYVSQRPGYDYTNLWYYIRPYQPVANFLLYPWANFDGVHYLSIAGNGYINDGRFFPLYPLLINFFAGIFGKGVPYGASQFLSGFLISNICFLLALIALYKLLRLDYKDRIAKWTIVLTLAFPVSFFFGAIYSESLFLLLAILSFHFMRKRKWWLASISSLLLTLTRPVGLIILPVLVYEFAIKEKKLSKVLPILFTPLGIISYAWFNFKKWGDALYFLHAQGQLANGRSTTSMVFFPQTIFRYFKILITLPKIQYELWIALFELTVFLLSLILLYLGWKKKIRFSYLLYSFLGIFIPASSGTFSGLPRYIMVLFPLFLALAFVKNKWRKIIHIVISIILLFILLAFFSKGYFVA